MADDDDLDPKQLGRSKAEEGRFTLTPAERKLARQTGTAGRTLDKNRLNPDEEGWVRDQTGLPNPSPNPFERGETKTSNYAKGGQVGRVGSFGLKRSKPDFAAGGGVNNFKKWNK